jgi:hypothetical protein
VSLVPVECPRPRRANDWSLETPLDQSFSSFWLRRTITLSIWRQCHARYGTKKPQVPEEISRLSDGLRARRNSQVRTSNLCDDRRTQSPNENTSSYSTSSALTVYLQSWNLHSK